MEKLTTEQLEYLVLTKAMADYADKEERYNDLNEVIDEIFADGALDREEYLKSIMKLTQLGYVLSDIKSEVDIEWSEAVGYEITGLTSCGDDYLNKMKDDEKLGSKVKGMLLEFDKVCETIAKSGVAKLTGSLIIPILKLIM